jgi:hypothetical protein
MRPVCFGICGGPTSALSCRSNRPFNASFTSSICTTRTYKTKLLHERLGHASEAGARKPCGDVSQPKKGFREEHLSGSRCKLFRCDSLIHGWLRLKEHECRIVPSDPGFTPSDPDVTPSDPDFTIFNHAFTP